MELAEALSGEGGRSIWDNMAAPDGGYYKPLLVEVIVWLFYGYYILFMVIIR